MSKSIKSFIFLSILLLLVCGCAYQGGTKQGVAFKNNLAGQPVLVGDKPCIFPLVNQPTKLNVLSFNGFATKYDDVFVWQRYEQMTGVDIVWTTVKRKDLEEAVFTALMNRADMDLFLRCKIDGSRQIQYGQKGLILDLAKDDLLKKNAPNCWAYLQSHPDTLASVLNPDGSIYSLPQVNSGAELRIARKIFINKKWLQNLNLPLPKTTEEMYQVLKAFKEKDANNNGDPNDEIPLCSADWQSVQQAFYGSFGLMNRGMHNEMVDCDESTGKVRLIAATPGYRDFLEYFQKLYAEGLLVHNIFIMTQEEWMNNALNDRIGVYCDTNLARFPVALEENWIGIPEALEGPNGDKMCAAVRANFHSTGNAIIPAACKDPALVLRWLDYFWTDAGTLFYHMGEEGKTYVAKADGSYDYMPYIYEDMRKNKLSFDATVSKYTPYPGGNNPTVETAPYFRGGEMASVPAETARALYKYRPKVCWPNFTFTTDESDALDLLTDDINKYCRDMRFAFVTGELPMSAWDNYLEQLHRFRTQEMLAIYQKAVDRYDSFSKGVKNTQ